MGSRYGGLKQLDPSAQTARQSWIILSSTPSVRASGKVVFVIRKDFEQDFRDRILSKYEGHIPVEVVFQSIDKLPEGYRCPDERVKPWGPAHAILMAKDVINEPFAVINADDFYGRNFLRSARTRAHASPATVRATMQWSASASATP